MINDTDKTVDKLRDRRDELIEEVQSCNERIAELENELESK